MLRRRDLEAGTTVGGKPLSEHQKLLAEFVKSREDGKDLRFPLLTSQCTCYWLMEEAGSSPAKLSLTYERELAGRKVKLTLPIN
jgi:hypothetical protein